MRLVCVAGHHLVGLLFFVTFANSSSDLTDPNSIIPGLPKEQAISAKAEDRCMDTVDPGPCQYFQLKWFWDEATETCREFHYGGCMGTRNRFNNRHECVKMCRYKLFNPVAVPDLCLLEPDQGHCGDERPGQWWYFFNTESGECEKFFYYGCGGNDNKFYSLHMCKQVCAERLSPQIACDKCDLRTSFCKAHSRMNYTCECRVGYEKNQYGECEDMDECRGYTAVCDRNAWCTNTVGSYRCECAAAYRGDGKHCTYVGLGRSSLDCLDCSPDATCANGICQCKKGFQGDGYNCTDVNECLKLPHVCDKNAECVNREGSFICSCLPGYAGNGYNCTKTKNSCLDKFDRGYMEVCGRENWRENFYFDHQSRKCQLMWYDGCPGRSRNIFSELQTCENMCEETNVLTRAEVCWDLFDLNYKNQCLNGQWQQRFYFDHVTLTCRQFWFDGCRSDSRNIFEDQLTCQWLCETQPMYKSRSCLEDFDHHYKDMCNGGRWRHQWYYDRQTKRCTAFWYDGCTGESENLFQDEHSCLIACENPAKKDPRQPFHLNDKHKMKELLEQAHKPNLTDICATKNPCKNNATCIWVWKKNMHYCKCQPGYTGDTCSLKLDKDPCARMPCQNGGSCKSKVQRGKATFDCYCASGYGGPTCEEKPCDVNPCLNNGTCRTTSGFSTYFCDCKESFGGKNCDIAIGSVPPQEEVYGKKVDLLSSGKEEWIQQMKQRLGSSKSREKGRKEKPQHDEAGTDEEEDEDDFDPLENPDAVFIYKDPATKKREREEKEKAEAEAKEKLRLEEEERLKAEQEKIAEELAEEAELQRQNYSAQDQFLLLVVALGVFAQQLL